MASLSVVPKIEGGAELREMVAAAMDCQRRVMGGISEMILRAIEIGRRLVKAKTLEVDHGEFRAWMVSEGIVGEGEDQIGYVTARRWMGLARFDEKHAGRLDNASTITHAYRLAGLLPDPESAPKKPAAGNSQVDEVALIGKEIEERLKLDQMERPQLEALAALLERLRGEVQARLGGDTPPTKESLCQGQNEGSKRLPALSYE